jgi:3-isopropylmalate dehydrogenase
MGSEADLIEKAIAGVLAQGLRTADIKSAGAKIVGTAQMGDAVIAEAAKLVA